MRIDKSTLFKDFIFYTDLLRLTEKQIEILFKKLEVKEQPISILKKQVPKDLNDLTYGELLEIQTIQTIEDMLFVPLRVIMGIDKEKALSCKAFDVIQFMLFVKKEIIRIGKLFSEIKCRHSAEEIQAGIDQINNGAFGNIDWYARRMGIVNHEYVETIPWVRLYKCMKIDNTNAMYEKRLREIYSKKK